MGRVSDGDFSHVYTGVWGSEILVWVRVERKLTIAIGSNRRPPEPYSLPRSYTDPSEFESKSWPLQAIANL